ncbi:hypothetical protein [Streptomyces sp. NPDC048644]|uniref:MmyB family transcriptional regulator n=1 Tax=Streptomyces sp. NPDC048644 TaxID=3365582 RepID=UPI00371A9BE0
MALDVDAPRRRAWRAAARLSEEAKHVILDWAEQAEQYLAMLRFTLFQHPKGPQVNALVSEILSDPYLARRWEEGTDVSEGRGPLRYRASLAVHDWRPVTLECQTLFPAVAPACRMVILVWIDDEDETPIAWGEDMAAAQEVTPRPVGRAA